jgi:hypothetical protein
MPSNSSFLIEFPANREYIPFIQDFLRGFLKNYDFSDEFSKRTALDSYSWFNTIIPNEKFLHAVPIVSFTLENSENTISVKIKTTDKREFTTSLQYQEAK